jgi:hypothetical protein
MPVPVEVIWRAPRESTSVLPIESWLRNNEAIQTFFYK